MSDRDYVLPESNTMPVPVPTPSARRTVTFTIDRAVASTTSGIHAFGAAVSRSDNVNEDPSVDPCDGVDGTHAETAMAMRTIPTITGAKLDVNRCLNSDSGILMFEQVDGGG